MDTQDNYIEDKFTDDEPVNITDATNITEITEIKTDVNNSPNSPNSPRITETSASSTTLYTKIFYGIIIAVVLLFVLWIIISIFTPTPPLHVLNQMLNNSLQITAATD